MEVKIRRKTKTGKAENEKVCENCNKSFLSNRKTAKVCSDRCRVEKFRKQADMKKSENLVQYLITKYGI